MTIIFDAKELSKFERLVTKLGIKKNTYGVNVCFIPTENGLSICVRSNEFFMLYDIISMDIDEPFAIRYGDFKDAVANADGNITFEFDGVNVIVSYTVKRIPVYKSIPLVSSAKRNIPDCPSVIQDINNSYFDAIATASHYTGRNYSRYTIGGVALVGDTGQIVSTDTRAMLVQDGFQFPWNSIVVCPITKLFGSKELSSLSDAPKIGSTPLHVYIESGPMKLWANIVGNNFPNYKRIIPDVTYHTKLVIDNNDAKFVIDHINLLPGMNNEVILYVDESRNIYIRGYDEKNMLLTGLRLTHSTSSNGEISIWMNRDHLRDAIRMGHREIYICNNSTSVSRGDTANFIWQPLEDLIVSPNTKVMSISSK